MLFQPIPTQHASNQGVTIEAQWEGRDRSLIRERYLNDGPQSKVGACLRKTAEVKAGDTLARIALDNGVNWRDLVKWNDLKNANVIEMGELLALDPVCGEIFRHAANESHRVFWQWPVLSRHHEMFGDALTFFPLAGAPVFAAADGIVTMAYWSP